MSIFFKTLLCSFLLTLLAVDSEIDMDFGEENNDAVVFEMSWRNTFFYSGLFLESCVTELVEK